MQKWEFTDIRYGILDEMPQYRAACAALGREGWELVTCFTENGSLFAFFKRPAK